MKTSTATLLLTLPLLALAIEPLPVTDLRIDVPAGKGLVFGDSDAFTYLGTPLPFPWTPSTFPRGCAPYVKMEWNDSSVHLVIEAIPTDPETDEPRDPITGDYLRLPRVDAVSYMFDLGFDPTVPGAMRGRQLGFCDYRSGWHCDGSTLKECKWGDKRSEYRCSLGCSGGRCRCGTSCRNGGTYDRFCTVCNCPIPWIGAYCETCPRTSSYCANSGVIDTYRCQCDCSGVCQNDGSADSRCNCNCNTPVTGWNGPTCNSCSRSATHCQNGGSWLPDSCRCSCAGADACQNGGSFRADGSCGCSCPSQWGGGVCADCLRDSSYCFNDGVMNSGTCECECSPEIECEHNGRVDPTHPDGQRCACTDCDGNWEGVLCEQCPLSTTTCGNNRQVNGTICECYCPVGVDCSDGGLSGGAIAGIVVGCLVFVGICVAIWWFCCRTQRHRF